MILTQKMVTINQLNQFYNKDNYQFLIIGAKMTLINLIKLSTNKYQILMDINQMNKMKMDSQSQ